MLPRELKRCINIEMVEKHGPTVKLRKPLPGTQPLAIRGQCFFFFFFLFFLTLYLECVFNPFFSFRVLETVFRFFPTFKTN